MGDDKNIRHRFTVPKDDDMVEEWIQAQSNLGFSLRVLIRAFVRSYGIKDATCMELGIAVRKVGRPPKQAQIALGKMMETAGTPDTQDSDGDGSVELFPQPAAPGPVPEPPRQAPVPTPQAETAGKSSIDDMFGIGKPSSSQQAMMNSILNLDS